MAIYGFIQARMRSTRLPGKVMLPIGTWSMLDHVLRRTTQVPEVAWRVVTGSHPSNAPIWRAVNAWPNVALVTWGGPEEDVLGRFNFAALDLAHNDLLIRVTADCPGWDPKVGEKVISLAASRRETYVANTAFWPDGLDTEVFPVWMLREAHALTQRSTWREHVTLWMSHQHGVTQLPGPGLRHQKFSVDTADDLQFIREIHQALGRDWSWRDVPALAQHQCPYPHPYRSLTSMSGPGEYEIPDLHEVPVSGGVGYEECPVAMIRKRRDMLSEGVVWPALKPRVVHP